MPPFPSTPDPWELWVRGTWLSDFVLTYGWLWPLGETLHYLGLSMLLGTVGLFDLRVLGVGKAIPVAALHRLIPFGVAGFVVNMLTGITFFSGFPEQYAYNIAFWWKGAFLAIAGLNVLLFYSAAFRTVRLLSPGEDASPLAKLMAGTSLFAWIMVLICGRLLTFNRPPFFH